MAIAHSKKFHSAIVFALGASLTTLGLGSGIAQAAPVSTPSVSTGIDTSIPKSSGPNEVGGALIAGSATEFTDVTLDGAGTKVVQLPSQDRAPKELAGAIVQVTATAGPSNISIAVKGHVVPIVDVPARSTMSTSALLPAGRSVSLTSTGAVNVHLRLIAWIENDALQYVPDGGVGVATKPVVRVDTWDGLDSQWLMQSKGQQVQLTGLGGIPTKVSAVLVEAKIDTDTPASRRGELLQGKVDGAWRTLSAAESGESYDELMLVPVSPEGLINIRSNAPMNVRLTAVGWLSVGKPWLAPDQAGGVVAVRPADLPAASITGGKVLRTPDLPVSDNTTALVTGQAFGSGQVQFTAAADKTQRSLQVRGAATSLVLMPQAQDGLSISAGTGVRASAQVVGYVRTAPSRAVRSKSMDTAQAPLAVALDVAEGGTLNRVADGYAHLSGTVTSSDGTESVAINVPGFPTYYALIDHLTNRFTAELVLPAGSQTFTVVATDSKMNTVSVTRQVQVIAPAPTATITSTNVRHLTADAIAKIETVTPNSVISSEPLALVPGNILVTDPFKLTKTGLSRVITAIEKHGSETVYCTKLAEITQMVTQAAIGASGAGQTSVSTPASKGKSTDLRLSPRATLTADPAVYPYSVDLPASFDLATLNIPGLTGSAGGSVGVSGAGTINLTVNVGWFINSMKTFSAKLDATMKAQIALTASYSDGGLLKAKLGEVQTVVLPFTIAGLPFVLRVPVSIFAKVGGKATLSAGASKYLSLEFAYDEDKAGWQTPVLDVEQPVTWSLEATLEGDTGIGVDIAASVTVAEVVGIAPRVELTAIAAKGTAVFSAGDSKTTGICSGPNPLRVYSGVGVAVDATVLGFTTTLMKETRWDKDWFTC